MDASQLHVSEASLLLSICLLGAGNTYAKVVGTRQDQQTKQQTLYFADRFRTGPGGNYSGKQGSTLGFEFR